MKRGTNISYVNIENMGVMTNLKRKEKFKKFKKGESSPKSLPNNKNDDTEVNQTVQYPKPNPSVF